MRHLLYAQPIVRPRLTCPPYTCLTRYDFIRNHHGASSFFITPYTGRWQAGTATLSKPSNEQTDSFRDYNLKQSDGRAAWFRQQANALPDA